MPNLKAVPKTEPLQRQETIPEDVRQSAAAIKASAERVFRVLGSPAALPAVKAAAKDELVRLSREALALWSVI